MLKKMATILCVAAAVLAAGPAANTGDTSINADEAISLSFKKRVSVEEANRIIDENASTKNGIETFYFGFDLRGSPQEDARQYLPFLDYLSRATGYEFKLRFPSKHSTVADDLGAGKTDFAAVGAVSFIQAQYRYGVVSLARGVNNLGKSEYKSFIVVRPDSNIKDVTDLAGRRFAFGSTSSTQGHLIPRIILAEKGIGLGDLGGYDYTGSHQNCASAVISGEYEACGMQDTMARNLIDQGLLKLLHQSRYFPSSGIAANRQVPANVLATMERALVDFDPIERDKETLHHWNRTEMPRGFNASHNNDYDDMRDWLVKLGLLNGNDTATGGKQRP